MVTKNEDGSISGTPWELLQHAIDEFKQLSPEEQEKGRQQLLDSLPPPNPPTDDAAATASLETEGEKGMTPEDAKRILEEAPEVEAKHPPLVGKPGQRKPKG